MLREFCAPVEEATFYRGNLCLRGSSDDVHVWLGGVPWPMWATSSSEVDMAFYIVTSIVLGGACAYALWYASKRRKQ